MSDPTLEADVAAYLAQPVTGERLPSTHGISPRLAALLPRLAAERGVPVDALVEFLLFKGIRAEQARRMVGEPLETLPASFVRDDIAREKVELAKDVAAIKGLREQPGDKASRVVAQMQAMLDDATGHDADLDAVKQKAATGEAMLDLALEKHRK